MVSAADGGGGSPFTFGSGAVFLPRDDRFFEDGDIHRHLYLRNATSSVGEVERPKVSEFCCHITGCSQLFDTLENYEHHYNTFHRNVCSSCKRSFPSSHLLDIHILEWHDSLFQILAAKQNMYLCLIESCTEKFKTSSDRKKHLIKVHGYPSDFRFDKPRKLKRNVKNRDGNPHDMEVEATVCQKETNDIFSGATVESMDQEPGETMEAESLAGPGRSSTAAGLQRPSVSCRVPATICFGHGSIRGFKNPKRKKRCML
ncbi:zinc finger protein 511 [Pristis pectinata]|uniref:zinc finger protein 511 n=1 Tax=Pristis pectinata TaxID=685728 RepID=UPI00223E6FC2|nr:zinc finger protein 511 [Pristis pectinata]